MDAQELSPGALRLLRLVTFAGAVRDAQELVGFQGDFASSIAVLQVGGLVETDPVIAPTDAGIETLESWYAADRRHLREEDKSRFLGRFQPLDREVKRLASLWQEAVSRDDWDKRLQAVEELSALHAKAVALIAEFAPVLPRFVEFSQRLALAHEKVLDGETEFFVAVRCDSYHTIWFQFHEDLLRLLQREREPE
ncbi:MAG TPA: hypothetical protein VHB68_17315 [Steroidobacteraceae bacterium]|nr:hypothetical protein [Steroidobacteraceae bacterium]